MSARVSALLLGSLLVAPPVPAAESPWRTLQVTLPAAELARAAGLEQSIERWRLVHEVARRTAALENDVYAARRRALAVGAVLGRSGAPREDVLVPVPLPNSWWAEALGRSCTDGELVQRLLTDERAGLLYRGLVQLDPATLELFGREPRLSRFLAERRPEVLALVAGSLRVRDGVVDVPGGERAQAAWRAAVGTGPDEASRFLRQLLEADEGRLALLFHVLQQLDPARQRFVLALDDGEAASVKRLRGLAGLFGEGRAWGRPNGPAMTRPLVDPATVLARVAVSPQGTLVAPNTRAFWRAVFEGESPGLLQRLLRDGEAIDIVWLAREVGTSLPPLPSRRLAQLGLAQRLFAAVEPGAPAVLETAAAVLDAVRAAGTRPALALVLERMQVRDPQLHVRLHEAARRAEALQDADERQRALALLQSAVAILDEASHHGALDAAATHALLRSLAALRAGDRGYGVVFESWLEGTLLPALQTAVLGGRPQLSAEDTVLRALAGHKPHEPGRVFEWEGEATRADPGLGSYLHLRRVRARQGAPTLDEALALSRFVSGCAEPGAAAPARSFRAAPIDPASTYALGRASSWSGLACSADPARSRTLSALADSVLAGALVSIVYAPHLGAPEGAALAAPHAAQRHEFGLEPFALPREIADPGQPWHVRGSLLALDAALARLSLRRISAELPPGPPRLDSQALLAFARSVSLRDPLALADDEALAIGAAVERGQARVRALTRDAAAADAVAGEAGLDAFRRQALPWLLARQPQAVPAVFTMAELMRVGGGRLPHDGWGLPQLAFGGGLLLRRPVERQRELSRRQHRGDPAASWLEEPIVAVALELAKRRLPASLAPALLGVVTEWIVDEGPLVAIEDPPALSVWLRELPAERWDDAISSLAGNGPLVPASAVESGSGASGSR